MISARMLVVLACVAQTLPARAQERVPVDGVAAVVERKVVTVSEVKAEARLALLDKAGPDAAEAPLDGRFLATVLDHVVVQELLAIEARNRGTAIVKESEVDAAVARVRASFGDPERRKRFFAQSGIDDELLRSRARRDLLVKALLLDVLGAAAKVSDDEARVHLNDHANSGIDDADRLKIAREQLSKERSARAFAELLERLRREIDVRRVATFG